MVRQKARRTLQSLIQLRGAKTHDLYLAFFEDEHEGDGQTVKSTPASSIDQFANDCSVSANLQIRRDCLRHVKG
jgi:hypothetical protein